MANKQHKTHKILRYLEIFAKIYLVILLSTGIVVTVLTLIRMHDINKLINNLLKNEVTQEAEYFSVQDVYEAPEDFIGTYKLICGYFCKEFATDTGIAWISDKKEGSKDSEQFIIRLERDKPFDYTPKAIAVFGKIELTEDKAIIIKDGSLYAYGGPDKEMLKHNDLIDADVFNVVMSALKYDETHTQDEALNILRLIAQQYEDSDLEQLISDIALLEADKLSLSQEDFETKAEKLWNSFRAQLLDR